MTRDRRGFTLVEIIVVAVLGSLVMGAALQVLVVNQRTYTAQTATISGQQTTRMALDVLFAELREVSASGGDILAMGTDSLRVRMMRKFGVVCDTTATLDPGADPVLRIVRVSSIFGLGLNSFAPNDSVFVFADNYENDDDDDTWIEAQVTDSAGGGTIFCPQDGTTLAVDLTFGNSQSDLFEDDTVGIGAPVRSFETFTFGTATFQGDLYFARRQGGGRMIPVAGPIRATNGLEFVYRDAEGAVTATSTDVRQIEVIVRTGSTVLNSLGGMVSDSITAWIYTRN